MTDSAGSKTVRNPQEATYPPQLPVGCYVELSPGGAAVWLVDEDGDWSEYPGRGEVTDGTPVAYYRVSDGPTWTGLATCLTQ